MFLLYSSFICQNSAAFYPRRDLQDTCEIELITDLWSSLDGAFDHDISRDGSRVLEVSGGRTADYGDGDGYAIMYELDENGDYSPIGPQLDGTLFLGSMSDDGNRVLLLSAVHSSFATLYDFPICNGPRLSENRPTQNVMQYREMGKLLFIKSVPITT